MSPSSEVETTVAAIWSELLGVAQVGRRHNFFELGGHSLLIERCCSASSQACEGILHHLCDQQRVPAELEEVVPAPTWATRAARSDGGDGGLDLALRGSYTVLA